MTTSADLTATTSLADLRGTPYRPRSVKDELRTNLVTRLRRGERVLPGVVGFDDTVLPDLERGLLAGHDLVLLGERGQAKTRIVRALASLLDPVTPVIAGCEINCDPYVPTCAHCRELAAQAGEGLPIVWIEAERRFSEKLATPDASVADLIGDVDPIKVAEGRHLGDEGTIHYGLVPRTNRGIFAINELPDLPERIQVALLNVLEERDVQIRGYRIRLPLDLLLVATANPDDYTNRGRIISPLKDRFGTQVRTHYPTRAADEIAIVHQEAAPPPPDIDVRVPAFLDEVVAELTMQLRRSSQINQRSGVSVRFTIGAHETLVAGAVRRAVRADEDTAVPRVVDLESVVLASLGRIEFDTLDEGHEEQIVAGLLRQAVLVVWRRRLGREDLSGLVARFEQGLQVESSDTMPSDVFLAQFDGDVPGLARIAAALEVAGEDPALAASALEFALEGLHLARKLNKEPADDEFDVWRFTADPPSARS